MMPIGPMGILLRFRCGYGVHERARGRKRLAGLQPGLEPGQDHWPAAVELRWCVLAELVVRHGETARVADGLDLPGHPRGALAFRLVAPLHVHGLHETLR